MEGKTCIVTGANSGIGKAASVELARRGERVVMVCRNRERGEAALADVAAAAKDGGGAELLLADLSSQQEIRRVAAEILGRYPAIDVLLNNAGAVNTSRTVTVDGIETTFATNHLNYFLLTNLLLDRIKAGAPARIINVSSTAHTRASINFNDPQFARGYGAFKAYGQSKLANVLFTYELARKLEGSGVTANALHPGVVRTRFGKNNDGMFGSVFAGIMKVVGTFFIGPDQGAATSVYLATSPEVASISGKYFSKCAEAPSSAASHDESAARRLWEMSEQMTGLGATHQGT